MRQAAECQPVGTPPWCSRPSAAACMCTAWQSSIHPTRCLHSLTPYLHQRLVDSHVADAVGRGIRQLSQVEGHCGRLRNPPAAGRGRQAGVGALSTSTVLGKAASRALDSGAEAAGTAGVRSRGPRPLTPRRGVGAHKRGWHAPTHSWGKPWELTTGGVKSTNTLYSWVCTAGSKGMGKGWGRGGGPRPTQTLNPNTACARGVHAGAS